MRQGVRFADGMRTLAAQGVGTFVEVGPHGVLCGMGAACVDGTFIPSLRRDRDEALTYAEALGRVHAEGHALDWSAVFPTPGYRRLALPTYAFERTPHGLQQSIRPPTPASPSSTVEDLLLRALTMVQTRPHTPDASNAVEPPPSQPTLAARLAGTPAPQRVARVMEALWPVMAAVLGASEGHTDTNRPLSHLGLDSLLAIELQKHIAELGCRLPMVELLRGPSMQELAELIVHQLQPTTPSSGPSQRHDDGWVVIPHPNPEATVRLFCFPYGGGGPAMFNGWEQRLPKHVELCLIQLPGRGARLGEPLLERMDAVVQGAADAMVSYLDRPFAVFGHCVGALQAFEVVHRLKRLTDQAPIHLFASGAAAPTDHHARFAIDQAREISPDGITPLHALGPDLRLQMLEEIGYPGGEAMANPELRAVFMEVLRADATVDGTYLYEGYPRLDIPITAVGGRIDPAVRYDSLMAWGQETNGPHVAVTTRGDHYFIHRDDHPWWDIFERVFRDVIDLVRR